MVSYYNPATVAMFSRTGTGHHYHHHHSPPGQNHYFGPGAPYTGYHHGHPHVSGQGGSGTGGSPVGAGIGVGAPLIPPSSTQFSPPSIGGAGDFNCATAGQYHPHHHHHQFAAANAMNAAEMGAGAASAAWHHQTTMYTSACAAARNAAALAVAAPHPAAAAYEEWSAAATGSTHPHHVPIHHHTHHQLHPSFYHHAQPSPPSSTPSPNSSHPHSPPINNNHLYSTSSTATSNNSSSTSNLNSSSSNNNNTTNHNNNLNNSTATPFKTEFGPCSSGNPQESGSQEMSGQVGSSSVGPSGGAPHSPDSGMAISDGVSSSGSPATGQQQYQSSGSCLGGPSSNGNGSLPTSSSAAPNDPNGLLGAQQLGGGMLHHHGSHLHGPHSHPHHHHTHPGNLNQMSISHQQGSPTALLVSRPTQARSPYEWMKKPAYSVGSTSSNNAKTRTKDKYRVVYSDTQRLELEKEFHYSRYITIRRKAELASILGLSERQVKIWFQNRRAKERKIVRKREEMIQREKIATMVHMQNAAVVAAGGMGGPHGNPMCNQPNGGVSHPPLM